MRKALVSLCLALALGCPLVASANEHEASGHGDEHAATFDDVNWYFGLLGEKEGLEAPDLLWRPKGMPVPFAALAFDTLLLYYVLYRVFGSGVVNGLRKRKQDMLRGMEEAAKMKREAEQQLQAYEEKFGQVDQEAERIRQQMRKNAEQEHARILQEAKERRERMERDAHLLVQQELKAVREQLLETTIESALKAAEETLRARLTEADQQRFGDEYIAGIHRAGAQLRGRV